MGDESDLPNSSPGHEEATSKIPVLIQIHNAKPRRKLSIDSDPSLRTDEDNTVTSHTTDGSNTNAGDMQLTTGENWLRLTERDANATKSILDETQDGPLSTQDLFSPFATILQGDAMDVAEKNAAIDNRTFLILDVDDHGPTIAIKDMRLEKSADSDTPYEICLARKKPTNDNEKDKASKEDKGSIWADYEGLEILNRRQMRIMKPGDRLCTRQSNNDEQSDDEEQHEFSNVGLILELTMVKQSAKKSCKKSSRGKQGDLDGTGMDCEDDEDSRLIPFESGGSSSDAEDEFQTQASLHQSKMVGLGLAQDSESVDTQPKADHKQQDSDDDTTMGEGLENKNEPTKEDSKFLTQDTEESVAKKGKEETKPSPQEEEEDDDATVGEEEEEAAAKEKAPPPTIIGETNEVETSEEAKEITLEEKVDGDKEDGDDDTTVGGEDEKKAPIATSKKEPKLTFDDDDDTTVGEQTDGKKASPTTKNESKPSSKQTDDDDDATVGDEADYDETPKKKSTKGAEDSDDETTMGEDEEKDSPIVATKGSKHKASQPRRKSKGKRARDSAASQNGGTNRKTKKNGLAEAEEVQQPKKKKGITDGLSDCDDDDEEEETDNGNTTKTADVKTRSSLPEEEDDDAFASQESSSSSTRKYKTYSKRTPNRKTTGSDEVMEDASSDAGKDRGGKRKRKRAHKEDKEEEGNKEEEAEKTKEPAQKDDETEARTCVAEEGEEEKSVSTPKVHSQRTRGVAEVMVSMSGEKKDSPSEESVSRPKKRPKKADTAAPDGAEDVPQQDDADSVLHAEDASPQKNEDSDKETVSTSTSQRAAKGGRRKKNEVEKVTRGSPCVPDIPDSFSSFAATRSIIRITSPAQSPNNADPTASGRRKRNKGKRARSKESSPDEASPIQEGTPVNEKQKHNKASSPQHHEKSPAFQEDEELASEQEDQEKAPPSKEESATKDKRKGKKPASPDKAHVPNEDDSALPAEKKSPPASSSKPASTSLPKDKLEEKGDDDDNKKQSLDGMIFAIIGKHSINKDTLQELIEGHGGEVKKRYGKTVTHLISAKDDTALAKKAKSAGATILTVEEVQQLISGGGGGEETGEEAKQEEAQSIAERSEEEAAKEHSSSRGRGGRKSQVKDTAKRGQGHTGEVEFTEPNEEPGAGATKRGRGKKEPVAKGAQGEEPQVENTSESTSTGRRARKSNMEIAEPEEEPAPASRGNKSEPAAQEGEQDEEPNEEPKAAEGTPAASRRGRQRKAPTPEPAPAKKAAKSTRKRKQSNANTEEQGSAKRARARTEGKPEDSDEIVILTTGVTLTNPQKTIIKKVLKGKIVEDVKQAHTATHIIAGDKGNRISLRRTPKLMIGLCNTTNIVDLGWLTACGKVKKALPVEDYLLTDDKEAEAQYDFSMATSLGNAAEMREKGKRVLSGWFVHVCKGVAGAKAPPEQQMKMIVEQAGGTWQSGISQKALADVEFSRFLIITSDPETKQQSSTQSLKNAVRGGASKQTTGWLFSCILKQEISFAK